MLSQCGGGIKCPAEDKTLTVRRQLWVLRLLTLTLPVSFFIMTLHSSLPFCNALWDTEDLLKDLIKFHLIWSVVVILLYHELFVKRAWSFPALVSSEGPGPTLSWWENNTSVKILIEPFREKQQSDSCCLWCGCRGKCYQATHWWTFSLHKNEASIMIVKGQVHVIVSCCSMAQQSTQYTV